MKRLALLALLVPPTINAPSILAPIVPYGGQLSSGLPGLVTTTAITTPGSSYTLKWDGSEWVNL